MVPPRARPRVTPPLTPAQLARLDLTAHEAMHLAEVLDLWHSTADSPPSAVEVRAGLLLARVRSARTATRCVLRVDLEDVQTMLAIVDAAADMPDHEVVGDERAVLRRIHGKAWRARCAIRTAAQRPSAAAGAS